MSIEIRLVCDACGQTIDISSELPAGKLRDRLRLYGGKTGLPRGQDMCGPCVTAGATL